MPSGNLPASGALGDPEISTGDYQAQINQLLAYVRDLQSEMAALSGTEIKEGAVRGVGNGAGLLADKAVLDTRLGTGGNLGSIATAGADEYIGTQDTGTVVFTGSSTGVTQANMGNPGAGLYLVKYNPFNGGSVHSPIYWDGSSASRVCGNMDKTSTLDWSLDKISIGSTGIVTVTQYYWYTSGGSSFFQESAQSVTQVIKV